MKKIHLFVCMFSIICLTSCSKEEILTEDGSDNPKEIILQERDPNTPWTPTDYKSNITQEKTRSQIILFPRMYVGCSFKNDVYPMEDTRNLGNEVIDIEKLEKDHPSYFKRWGANNAEAYYFSYAAFERYVSKSTTINNFTSGSSINLGLLSIGNKNTYKTIFTKSLIEDNNSVLGELNIIIRDSLYRLQTSSRIKEDIKENYLSDDFKNELYNTHPSEFFSNYGGFVLTDFVTGGKVTALYAGSYNKTESTETKEKNMGTEINASYGFQYKGKDNDGKMSGDLTLGRTNNSETSITKEFSSVMMAIKTIGGSPKFPVFSIPKEIKDMNVDLSGWINSLTDKSTHSIIEFNKDGLSPITDFIIEENLKNQINEYYKTGVSTIKKLQEPYIKIYMDYYNGQLAVLNSAIVTRFGDLIPIRSKLLMTPEITAYEQNELSRLSKIFGTKIIGLYSTANTRSSISHPGDIITFDKEHMNKVTTQDGTVYLLYKDESRKIAYSIHNNFLLDTYCFREFVNQLPSSSISFEELMQYTIYAL